MLFAIEATASAANRGQAAAMPARLNSPRTFNTRGTTMLAISAV
jgi:hypothetical protein